MADESLIENNYLSSSWYILLAWVGYDANAIARDVFLVFLPWKPKHRRTSPTSLAHGVHPHLSIMADEHDPGAIIDLTDDSEDDPVNSSESEEYCWNGSGSTVSPTKLL